MFSRCFGSSLYTPSCWMDVDNDNNEWIRFEEGPDPVRAVKHEFY